MLTTTDLNYDLMTMVRTYDRANDFDRRNEYERLLREVERNDQEWEEAIEELETQIADAENQCAELNRQQDINARLLNTISGIARDALASTEDRDDIDNNEAALLDALSDILRHAEA